MRVVGLFAWALGAFASPMFGQAAALGVPAHYKLQYEQDFEKPDALKDFVLSDTKAWNLSTTNGNTSLELAVKSDYKPKHRSPFNIALVADKAFGDFILDVELQSTVKPYNHQDMCVFYNFENTNRFYYTHIAVKPDPIKAQSHAHDIFIVNDAERLAIAKTVSQGVTWGQDVWHKVRIERKLADGAINVYFDDFSQPIMTGSDKTFTTGFIGFGSFDDKGKIDNIKIYAPVTDAKRTGFFTRP